MTHPSTFLRFDGRLWENLRFRKYLGWETDRIAHRPLAGDGEYRVALLDERGAPLAEVFPLVDFDQGCTSGVAQRSSRVTAYVPVHERGRQLVFARGEHEIWRGSIAKEQPSLSDIQVIQKEPERYLVRWTARAEPSQQLTFRVFYFVDKRHGFPLASSLTEPDFLADIGRLPGGADCQFGVLATDGLRSRIALSAPMSVRPRPPRVMVHTPQRGGLLSYSAPGAAVGSSFDAFGRELSEEGLLWILDGHTLARSVRQVELPRIEPGPHRLTLRYHGTDGMMAEDDVEFSVASLTPLEEEWMRLREETAARIAGLR